MGKKYNRLRRDGTFLSHAELKGWDCKIKAPEVFEAATQIHNVCLHVFGGALNFDPVAQRSESDKEMRPKLINGVFTREDPRKF